MIPRLLIAGISGIALVTAAMVAVVVGPAPLATASDTFTFTFVGTSQSNGTVQTWVVPADVKAITLAARGGDGAGDTMPNEDPRKFGGHGAVVTTTAPVTVTPGATLSIYVAGRGDPGRGNNAAGKGGWGYASGGQGGSGYAGGGGGGASAVVSDLNGLLIVAGGGGGAGAERGADGGTAAYLHTAVGAPGFGTSPGGGGDDSVGGAAGTAGSVGIIATAGESAPEGGDGGAGAKRSSGSRSYPFGGGGGGGFAGGGGGGGDARSGTDFGGSGGGAGSSFSIVDATYTPSTLPWNPGDLRTGHPGEVTITVVPEPPLPPPPPIPAGPPIDVAGSTGNRSATLTWSAPESTGSFPVTHYQVMSSPSGGMCLTTTLACKVTGLRNGVDYTFTVRALTGAGWSPWSQASPVLTPRAPITPTILITGSRGEVRGKPGVVVAGTSSGLGMGTILTPWIRIDDAASFSEGSARILVDTSGEFTWQRRGHATLEIQMRTPSGELSSNILTIPRR